MSGFVAVHCGAGHHSQKYYSKYNKLSKRASRTGVEILRNGGSALDAVKAAISILENDALTNAGFGSNLTSEGTVEGDASIMNGDNLVFGGCGAVRSVKNPICLAHDICIKQTEQLPLGLVPPMLLVGKGATQHAKSAGLKLINNRKLISSKAARQFKKYKKMLDDVAVKKSELLDTVGAVCVDGQGRVAAGCSSGGIILKRPGRLGQAAVYGCGVWADSFNSDEPLVAVCTTGCGEYLIQTQLAKEIGEELKNCSCPTLALNKSMTDKFLNSRYLRNVQQKLGGALALHINDKTGDLALVWGHSTESMSIGFMRTEDQSPKGLISELPRDAAVGCKINVSGVYFYKND